MFCCCGPTRRTASVSDLSRTVAAQSIASASASAVPGLTSGKQPKSRSLHTRRRHFWETAATYGGRPQIWAALQEYCDLYDTDPDMAMTVLSSVGAVVRERREGSIEVYDETGFRYDIPEYCLIVPADDYGPQMTVINGEGTIMDEPCTVVIRFANITLPDLKIDTSTASHIGDLLPAIHAHAKDTDCKQVLFFRCGQGPIPCDCSIYSVKQMVPDAPILVIQAMFR